MANLTGSKIQWIKMYRVEQEDPPDVWWIPFLCMHCDNPPCLTVCPTHALVKTNEGVVVVDYDKCNGCGICVMVCPYDALEINKGEPYFSKPLPFEQKAVEEGGYRLHKPFIVEKCTLCIDNPETKQYGPACVRCCPTTAIVWGDLDDPKSEVSALIANNQAQTILPELGTKPRVYYIGLPPKSLLAQLPIKAKLVKIS